MPSPIVSRRRYSLERPPVSVSSPILSPRSPREHWALVLSTSPHSVGETLASLLKSEPESVHLGNIVLGHSAAGSKLAEQAKKMAVPAVTIHEVELTAEEYRSLRLGSNPAEVLKRNGSRPEGCIPLPRERKQLSYQQGLPVRAGDNDQWKALVKTGPPRDERQANAEAGLRQAAALLGQADGRYLVVARDDIGILIRNKSTDAYSRAVICAAQSGSALGAFNLAALYYAAIKIKSVSVDVTKPTLVEYYSALHHLNAAFLLAQDPIEDSLIASAEMAVTIREQAWQLLNEAIDILTDEWRECLFKKITQTPDKVLAGTAICMALYYFNVDADYSSAIGCAKVAWQKAQSISLQMPPAAAADIAFNAIAVIRESIECLGEAVKVELPGASKAELEVQQPALGLGGS